LVAREDSIKELQNKEQSDILVTTRKREPRGDIMKTITAENTPPAVGPYSAAVVTGNLLYTSGQMPMTPQGELLADADIQAQTEQVIKNLTAIAEAAGTSLDKTVKTTCFLADMNDFAAFNEVYGKYFTTHPARSCVQVARLPKDARVEVEAFIEL
jgi:2-iminobutanoate/2-iminopropanoate deaminase